MKRILLFTTVIGFILTSCGNKTKMPKTSYKHPSLWGDSTEVFANFLIEDAQIFMGDIQMEKAQLLVRQFDNKKSICCEFTGPFVKGQVPLVVTNMNTGFWVSGEPALHLGDKIYVVGTKSSITEIQDLLKEWTEEIAEL